MLEVVVEAVDYLEATYQDDDKTAGSLVLSGVFEALGKVLETNVVLTAMFDPFEEMTNLFNEFEKVIGYASAGSGC
ncbi:hypothetical protein LCM10_09995 [Rossellomorea aquimaris]|uniref:hypothetical protein n=1 Tax=Rossellomorea aquimaris TaxID=189382 RepID=UPI001CD789B6|nr:hypothetical protein [Rossellomorea aquimaris]MCA1055315.1 hypothetical protein [Rossellomorea aquimaris]